MAARGQVYFPQDLFPPKQNRKHWIVVLTNTTIAATHARYVLCAIVRSAPCRMVFGHSIPISPANYSFLAQDSVVETHQLFHIETQRLGRLEGQLKEPELTAVMNGARLHLV